MSRLHIERHNIERIGWLRAAVLDVLGARAGGAPVARSVMRVVIWGALAMAVTAGVGKLFNTTIG